MFRIVLPLVAALAFVAAPLLADSPKPLKIKKGADPWAIEIDGRYYWSQSNNSTREIWVWVSDSPNERGERKTIWRAPESGPCSRELWAPELHRVDGRCVVLFAADDGKNRNHRTFALVSESDDPLSKYELRGPIYTGDNPDGETANRWAIDATLFERPGEPGEAPRRYLIWSGWEDDRDVQFLYIAPFDAETLQTTAPRVRICSNDDYLWERVEERLGTRGLNEGPEILVSPNGRTFLTYSCGASWLPTYKVGLLELTGDDPLDPASWRKFPEPFFQSDETQFGVGHGSFVRDKTGELRYLYHAKVDRAPGWNREVFSRPVEFDADGFPRIVK